jgi:hypothetical protein
MWTHNLKFVISYKFQNICMHKINVVSTVHFQMRCVQKSPTNAHKLFNSLCALVGDFWTHLYACLLMFLIKYFCALLGP